MIPSLAKPIMRPEVEHLFEAESLARKARRMIIPDPENPPKGSAVAAEQLIRDAISHLVAARALLNVESDAPERKHP